MSTIHSSYEELKRWPAMVRPFIQPNIQKAAIQILNSFLPFFALLGLMYWGLTISYWITLLLSPLAAFFLVRIFIIQHDCGHQSFLPNKLYNNLLGRFCSYFSTIPYHYWSANHAAHHAHNGQLEHRGLGDIYYMTTEEYARQPRRIQWAYRFFRHPLVMFVLVPISYFLITLRYPFKPLPGWQKIRAGYVLYHLSLVAFFAAWCLLLGWKTVALIYLPVLLEFSIISFWFFYMQHQHTDNYRQPRNDWDHLRASMEGSTYYKLPRVFQWLTGNIGLHHIHHLNSRIPNYNLEACGRANPELMRHATVLTFSESLRCTRNKLWDEGRQRMITMREYRAIRKSLVGA